MDEPPLPKGEKLLKSLARLMLRDVYGKVYNTLRERQGAARGEPNRACLTIPGLSGRHGTGSC